MKSDQIAIQVATIMASFSRCVRRKVGAVIVKEERIVSTGYNGPPSGTVNCDELYPGEGCSISDIGTCSLALHAEENAIMFALKNGVNLKGAKLFSTLSPCLACARIIKQSGINEVWFLESYAKKDQPDYGVEFLVKFGVIAGVPITTSMESTVKKEKTND
jgi:dCMP deaminase